MAKINKFGEIDEMACPGCSGPIKAEWVACPTCGEGLKASEAKKAKKQKPPLQDKFICPGCGEKATAQNGLPCGHCKAFVHYACISQGRMVDYNGGNFSDNECLCPLCDTVLGVAEYYQDEFYALLEFNPTQKHQGIDKEGQVFDKQICPGCEEASNAKTGIFCKNCKAYVHKECVIRGPSLRGEGDVYEDENFGYHACICPNCNQVFRNGLFSRINGKFYKFNF